MKIAVFPAVEDDYREAGLHPLAHRHTDDVFVYMRPPKFGGPRWQFEENTERIMVPVEVDKIGEDGYREALKKAMETAEEAGMALGLYKRDASLYGREIFYTLVGGSGEEQETAERFLANNCMRSSFPLVRSADLDEAVEKVAAGERELYKAVELFA